MVGEFEHTGKMESGVSAKWNLWVAWAALWFPAMAAASYEWRHGEYYSYGWMVPAAALMLLWMRWRDFAEPDRLPKAKWVAAGVAAFVGFAVVMRVLGQVDPMWRLPMWGLGLAALVASHGLVGWCYGWGASLKLGWISLLLFSALPWPSVMERAIVGNFTDAVIAAVAELSLLFGRPVEVVGDRLFLNGEAVEVAAGCSGMRSFQTFLMAAWFFAELRRFGRAKGVVLVAFACLVAFVVNVIRTLALVDVRFSSGQESFDRMHDWLGVAAFVVSGYLFFAFSNWLDRELKEKRVSVVRMFEDGAVSMDGGANDAEDGK